MFAHIVVLGVATLGVDPLPVHLTHLQTVLLCAASRCGAPPVSVGEARAVRPGPDTLHRRVTAANPTVGRVLALRQNVVNNLNVFVIGA